MLILSVISHFIIINSWKPPYDKSYKKSKKDFGKKGKKKKNDKNKFFNKIIIISAGITLLVC